MGAKRTTLEVGGCLIGPDAPVFVIAEAGVNHDGDIDVACDLVDAAAAAGAQAVKFQTFRASDLATATAPRAAYQERNDPGAASQVEMLRKLELDAAAHRVLVDHCVSRDILFLSTPFDEASVRLLADLGVAAFKTSSGDLTHGAFLRFLAQQQRPLLISTGMANSTEVDEAVSAIGDVPFALLHCVSAYPAPDADANLTVIPELIASYGVPIGWSDHTEGIDLAPAAVALGATIVEKHLTLDRTRPGPDHAASIEPPEFRSMVDAIRRVEQARGDGRKRCMPSEEDTRLVARRSIVAARDIAAGAELTADDLACRRPGTGLAPNAMPTCLGRYAKQGIGAGTVIEEAMLL